MLPIWYDWTLVTCLSYIETVSWFISSFPIEEKKEKNVEANYVYEDNDIFDPSNMSNLDVTDFFETPEEKIVIVGGMITCRNTSYYSILSKIMKSYCMKKKTEKKVGDLIILWNARYKRTLSMF